MESAALNSIGQVFLGFEVTHYLPLPELRATLIELVHLKSGAKVLHLANNDPENVFCLSFQTLPASSNGAPHILEHTVLCGSKKFPVKDPFFSMQKRSLQTFMNAFTGADFTCYPASSQVEKDFYNLLDVYLDAVFYPELKKMSFLQEGHRLELLDPEHLDDSPLKFQGIVYNEMKGALSNPTERLSHTIRSLLMPDLPYSFESGGIPSEIPNLSYEELVSFHKEYYHPSHCIFFFYGNLPLEKHLHFIEERVLCKTEKIHAALPIARQKRMHFPLKGTHYYPISETETVEDKSYIAFSWLTVPIGNQSEILALNLLESIWFETDASFLKKKLLESGLCQEVESSIDDDISEVLFTIVFKGCNPKDAEKLEKLLFDSLQEFSLEAPEEKNIEAALYQLEMDRCEIGGDGFPFGLQLFFRSALLRAHGLDPQHGLLTHSLFKELRASLKDETYLCSLVKTQFLDNKHRLALTFIPDPSLMKQEADAEVAALKKIGQHLSKQDRIKILQESIELKKYQEEVERQSLDCLPKVTLQDVPKEPQDFQLMQDGLVYHHPVFTNQFTYADLVFNLPHFNIEELPYVSLLSQLWTSIGFGNKSYEEALFEVEDVSGGIDGLLSIYVKENMVQPTFSLRGKSLDRKNARLLKLMHDYGKSPRFDEKKRILEWFGQHASDLEESKVKRAMGYASKQALSENCISSKLQNLWHGLPYYEFIQTLKKDKKHRWIEKLKTIAKKMTSSKPDLVLSCSEDAYLHLKQIEFAGILKGWEENKEKWTSDFTLTPLESQSYAIAAPVAFTALATKCAAESADLLLSTEIFGNTILHKEIREKGGAYGSGANYSTTTGNFYFYSYRDPHLFKTLEIFKTAIQKIGAKEFTDVELEEAKLGLIGSFDTPVSPGMKAITAYSWLRSGKTLQKRKAFREKILNATVDEIAASVLLHLSHSRKNFVSLLGQEIWDKEKDFFSDKLQIKTVD